MSWSNCVLVLFAFPSLLAALLCIHMYMCMFVCVLSQPIRVSLFANQCLFRCLRWEKYVWMCLWKQMGTLKKSYNCGNLQKCMYLSVSINPQNYWMIPREVNNIHIRSIAIFRLFSDEFILRFQCDFALDTALPLLEFVDTKINSK